LHFSEVTAAMYREELTRDAFINGLSSASIRQRLLERADNFGASFRISWEPRQSPTPSFVYGVVTDSTFVFDHLRPATWCSRWASASFSYPADCNMNHSPPSCPSTAVAQRRVNKEVVKKSGKRCSFYGGQFHPRYSCPTRDATCFSCGKPGHFARVCQSNTGYKSAPPKAVVSVSSIEKPYLASAPSSLKPAVVDGLLYNFPVHILVDSGASKNFVDFKICQKLHLAINGLPTSIGMASSEV